MLYVFFFLFYPISPILLFDDSSTDPSAQRVGDCGSHCCALSYSLWD
ncbi:hypothetical protein TorRG33x02_233460 [Trema orientale]|uniref:Uncharacterized protein n=1 Tax=Trema orientale TaxID=63057 RepID=A0A2P5E5S1_TREOI|nr:hypothetical protein TorRG33x02_233460 [Trema orientale]